MLKLAKWDNFGSATLLNPCPDGVNWRCYIYTSLSIYIAIYLYIRLLTLHKKILSSLLSVTSGNTHHVCTKLMQLFTVYVAIRRQTNHIYTSMSACLWNPSNPPLSPVEEKINLKKRGIFPYLDYCVSGDIGRKRPVLINNLEQVWSHKPSGLSVGLSVGQSLSVWAVPFLSWRLDGLYLFMWTL